METGHDQTEMFSSGGPAAGTLVLNGRCVLTTDGARRVVIASGVPCFPHRVGDRAAEAYAMVSLVEGGIADQVDVARAFGRTTRTVRRYQRSFETGGLGALGRGPGYPKGRPRLPVSRGEEVRKLKDEGVATRDVARRFGVTEKAVRNQLGRLGWKGPLGEQVALELGPEGADPNVSARATVHRDGTVASVVAADPNLSGPTTEVPEDAASSFDTDPSDRAVDRLLAYVGMLDDAAPVFAAGVRVPRAGVLLAVPVLVQSGVFEIARRVYGSIGPAFYGLRTTLVTLLLMALLRIKRPEGLKEVSPADLGRVLGLDRAPEVKTVRRKLKRLAGMGRAATFGRELAVRRVGERGAAMGFLYVDGHVRVYHGQHVIPKAHVSRMRISLPATTDYWVNDSTGDPLFVLTANANAGLVKMMPSILAEVRALVPDRRVTVVFDRGGFSPKLFEAMYEGGFDVLTYRKGAPDPVPEDAFTEHEVPGSPTRQTMRLHEKIVILSNRFWLRQVTRLADDGHQTQVLTTLEDLPAVDVAVRMFDRWRQENFFKYMRDEYALDALVNYGAEADDPDRDVPNPDRRAVDLELADARARLARHLAVYGDKAISNREAVRPTMRGFKIAHSRLGKAVREAMKLVASLEARRAAVPDRVQVAAVVPGKVVKLAAERQLLASLVKMVAYQAETDLVRLVAPHYSRAEDEGRTLIQSALNSPADIVPWGEELIVRIAPLSSAHRSRALAALCRDVNALSATFPGSKLRLRFEVAATPHHDREPDKS
jgi:transposase